MDVYKVAQGKLVLQDHAAVIKDGLSSEIETQAASFFAPNLVRNARAYYGTSSVVFCTIGLMPSVARSSRTRSCRGAGEQGSDGRVRASRCQPRVRPQS
jgi:hypothetical protein